MLTNINPDLDNRRVIRSLVFIINCGKCIVVSQKHACEQHVQVFNEDILAFKSSINGGDELKSLTYKKAIKVTYFIGDGDKEVFTQNFPICIGRRGEIAAMLQSSQKVYMKCAKRELPHVKIANEVAIHEKWSLFMEKICPTTSNWRKFPATHL